MRSTAAERELRASDAEREQSVMVLRDAVVEGRLTLEEFGDRVGTVTVIVSEGVVVRVEGGGLMASQIVEAPASRPVAGAPILRIRLSGPGGTLHLRTTEPSTRLQRLLGARSS